MRIPTSALIAVVAGGCLLAGSTGGAVAGAMITGAQIKDGSVTGKDVKDKSLSAKDLTPESLDDLAGAAGPAGPPGTAGVNGTNGTNGVSGYKFTFGAPATPGGGAPAFAFAACPVGKRVLGGGGLWATPTGSSLLPGNVLAASAPAHAVRDTNGNATDALVISDGTTQPDAWIVNGTNHDAGQAFLVAYVICASVS